MKLFVLLVAAIALAFADMPGASAAPLGARPNLGDDAVTRTVVPIQAHRGGRGARVYQRGGMGGTRNHRAAPRHAAPRGARIARPGPDVRRAQVARPRNLAPRAEVRRPGPRTIRREAVRRPPDRRFVDRRRDRAGVGRSGRAAYVDGRRHYRSGRWHTGSPRWRGERRWHGGRYWRPAYDGWYHWHDNAWIWAPTFGIIAAATLPVWAAGTSTVVLVTYDPWTPDWYDWCARRYRSFDPRTGFWISYSGVRRFCVYH